MLLHIYFVLKKFDFFYLELGVGVGVGVSGGRSSEGHLSFFDLQQ